MLVDKATVDYFNTKEGCLVKVVIGLQMTENGPAAMSEDGTLLRATEAGVAIRTNTRGEQFWFFGSFQNLMFPSSIEIAKGIVPPRGN